MWSNLQLVLTLTEMILNQCKIQNIIVVVCKETKHALVYMLIYFQIGTRICPTEKPKQRKSNHNISSKWATDKVTIAYIRTKMPLCS